MLRRMLPRSHTSIGLHRLGIVLGVSCLLLGMFLVFEENRFPSGERKQLSELTSDERRRVRLGYEAREIAAGKQPLPESNVFWDLDEHTMSSMPRRLNLLFPGLALVAAVASYVFARSVGWIIDGFTGGDR